MIKNLPKGHHIIFVTPYNGSKSGSKAVSLVQLRKYELEMAKKYDFVTVADWYQVAKENISIWNGTDGVHFGSDSDSINRGAKLYTNTIKEAIAKANQKPVKGGKIIKKEDKSCLLFCGQILTQFLFCAKISLWQEY